ncbi:hypothetical protein AVEN_62762-1 [Araneus ventricosus]|uniref:Uncharacterized protein n=1 Tax=Araneus ventricosus TaxID=182803 RepID=A0A4Y2WQW9_ARAVE|nr:hypothetical protein AVEN_62762-1 [Araneus ventricosus]
MATHPLDILQMEDMAKSCVISVILVNPQRKRIRGLTPQFDQRPHSPSKGTSHIDIHRRFKRSKVAAMLAVLCSMSILRTKNGILVEFYLSFQAVRDFCSCRFYRMTKLAGVLSPGRSHSRKEGTFYYVPLQLLIGAAVAWWQGLDLGTSGSQARNPIPSKICCVWDLLHAKSYAVSKRPPVGVVPKF